MFKVIILMLFPMLVLAEVSLNNLPLVTDPTQVQVEDTFPIVNNFGPPTTKRLYIKDLLNVTSFKNKFTTLAPLASPIFTGTAVGTFAGTLNGNATNVSGIVAIANGGTGASTADNALNNLLPSQSGNSGKAITTNGSSTLWSSVANTVNGYFGTVILSKSDIGLANADNTSDVDKPISAAAQTALDLKAPLLSPALTGTPTAPTATFGDNSTKIATTAFVAASAPPSANQHLSNLLSPVAINQDLLPDTHATRFIGAPNNSFVALYAYGINAPNGSAGINLNARRIYDSSPSQSIDYDSRLLNDASGTQIAVNWQARKLQASDSSEILNWSTPGIATFNSTRLVGLAEPVNPQDAATRAFVLANATPSGANRSLSNLTTTGINQALLPDADVNQNIGSLSYRWGNIFALGISYLGKVSLIDASNGLKGNFLARSKTVDGISYTGPEITAGGSTYIDIAMSTNPDGSGDATPTGSAIIFTGDKQNGTGNSGSIKLYTGTSAGGTRGKIILSGSSVDVNSSKIINAADPVNPQDVATRAFVLANSSPAGANQSLSNLTNPTSINQGLIPVLQGTYDLGGINKQWGAIYGLNIYAGSTDKAVMGYQGSSVSAAFQNPNLPNTPGAFYTTYEGDLVLSPAYSGTAARSAYMTTPSYPAVTTGKILLATGNSGSINSGPIVLKTGTAGGTRGVISLDGSAIDVNSKKIINLATPTALTDAASKGYVDTAIGSGGGANTTLSNLTDTVAINKTLYPATDLTVNLGSETFRWLTVNGFALAAYGTAGGTTQTLSMQKITGSSVNFPNVSDSMSLSNYGTVSTLGIPLAIMSHNDNVNNSDNSIGINILSGNKTAGTGGSGPITIKTGTSAGGTRGVISLSGSAIDLNGTKVINKASLGLQTSAADNGSYTGGSFVDVTSLTITITTGGRPVYLGLISGGSDAYIQVSRLSEVGSAAFKFVRGSTDVATVDAGFRQVGSGTTDGTTTITPGTIWHIDSPTAGTYTYKLQVVNSPSNLGAQVNFNNVKLIAYEL